MTQVEPSGCLERMPERVPVVQERSSAALGLVGGHHLGLDGHARGDELWAFQRRKRLAFCKALPQRPSLSGAANEPRCLWRAADEVVLGEFAVAGSQLALGQGVEHFGVAEHRCGLPEGTYEVLALGEVHAGLAADGRVDLTQQRGGDMDGRHAAVVHSGPRTRLRR